LSVGRTRENHLCIDDASVSKIHASLALNSEKQLMVADTGSTNGTFINDRRIAYGKAIPINDADKLKFGTVEVTLQHIVEETEDDTVLDRMKYCRRIGRC
jgi:pSer/pThr/pTyr-binding forkhead associated (FHA) protein